jgi:hypothetical protein
VLGDALADRNLEFTVCPLEVHVEEAAAAS